MYSKNDYRYYLERRMVNDNYLAHSRAHKYIKKIGKRYFYTQQELDAFMNKDKKRSSNAEDVASDIRYGVANTVYNTFKPRDKAKQMTPSVISAQERGKKQTAKIRSQQTISREQTKGESRTKQFKGKSSEYLREYENNSKKNNSPKTKSTGKKNTKIKSLKTRASNYRKKHNIKNSVFNKDVWKRETPKGKKIKGSNIYVSHE